MNPSLTPTKLDKRLVRLHENDELRPDIGSDCHVDAVETWLD